MAEEQTVETVVPEKEISTTQNVNDALVSSILGIPVNKSQGSAEAKETANVSHETSQQQTQQQTQEEIEEEILDENDYVKRMFEFDSVEAGRQYIEDLKKKAENVFEYKNEDSKKIAQYINEGKYEELYNYLDTQMKVTKLSSSEIADINTATELVKFGMKRDNPNLSQDDIDFLFNKKYSITREPVQAIDETDDEYAGRKAEWQQNKDNLQREMIIEAKMAQPKIAQMKSELILPDIQKEAAKNQYQPTAEELQKAETFKNSYLQSVDKSVNSLNGISMAVKDKDVEIPLKYDFTPQQKEQVSQRMKDFANNGYNATAILADLWVTEKGEVNTDKMAQDLAYLLYKDSINQKLVEDAANKRLEAFLKDKKQINLRETDSKGTATFAEPKTAQDALTKAWLSV